MNILEKAEQFAKKEYPSNDDRHQWSHIESVMARAMEIASSRDDVDVEVLKLAIIFHDIDYTTYETHVDASVAVAKKFLTEHDYPVESIKRVAETMLDHSTPHRKERGEATSIEGKIIYDADKSISIVDKVTYDKYYPKLYLEETKALVPDYS